MTYGTAGVGTGQHMTGAFLAQKTGINATHIPFRGDANSITALLSGDVDFVLAPPTAVLPHIRSGKLRAVAISGSSRWSSLPDVPTVAEQGVKDYEVRSWTALLAPAGTPASVIDRLNAAVRTALSDPAIRLKLEEATGGDVRASSPKELAVAISSDVQRWTQLVKDAGIQKE
jgi:tripartite-type tricarboxylate transporter receptor subunit TctC